MKPLITLALGTYNQERFVSEAVKASLVQTYSPLEIIISDDCSRDRTFQIIQNDIQDYSGPHRLRINRNHHNLGVAGHLNRVVEMSSGQLIVLASGDDISLPDRVEQTYRCWVAIGKKALAIFTQARVIDDTGRTHGLVLGRVDTEMLSVEWMLQNYPIVHGYGLAFSRRLFDVFGPLPQDVLQEDTIIPIRAALLGPLAYVETPLVLYRRHQENLWKMPGIDVLNVKQFLTFLNRHAKSRIAVCRCWLQDLETARGISPNRQEVFCKYEHLAQQKLLEEATEAKLLVTGLFERLSILLDALRRGTEIKKILEWAVMYNLPAIYLAYKRIRRRKLTKVYGTKI